MANQNEDEVSLRMLCSWDLILNKKLKNAALRIENKEDNDHIHDALVDIFESLNNECDYISMPYSIYKSLYLNDHGFPSWNSDSYKEGSPWYVMMGESENERRRIFKTSDSLSWLHSFNTAKKE